MKITETLLAEHVVFHNLFDHIERVLPGLRSVSEVRTLASVMETMLESHSRVEDDLLIAPMEHCMEQLGQKDTFHKEHEEIDEALRRIPRTTNVIQARRMLLKAVVASRRHFDKEERIVFPLAERVLNENTLRTLGQSWMKRSKVAAS